jgi:hypothetical protein
MPTAQGLAKSWGFVPITLRQPVFCCGGWIAMKIIVALAIFLSMSSKAIETRFYNCECDGKVILFAEDFSCEHTSSSLIVDGTRLLPSVRMFMAEQAHMIVSAQHEDLGSLSISLQLPDMDAAIEKDGYVFHQKKSQAKIEITDGETITSDIFDCAVVDVYATTTALQSIADAIQLTI